MTNKDLLFLFDKLHCNKISFEMDKIGHNNFVLGTRSTYISDPNVFDFLHEIAHLIQLSDDEIYTHYIDYDGYLTFVYPTATIGGVYYNDPQTDKMSMRELETFCIQYYLDSGLLKKDLSFYEWMEENDIESLFTWIPDDINFGYKIKHKDIEIKAQDFLSKWNLENVLNRWKYFNKRIEEIE